MVSEYNTHVEKNSQTNGARTLNDVMKSLVAIS